MGVHVEVEDRLVQILVGHGVKHEEHEAVGHRDEEGRLEDLRPAGELAHGEDDHQSGDDLHHHELVGILQRGHADEHHRDVGHKGRARVEEHPEEHRGHSEGQYVDREEVVLHDERHQDGEDGDERVEHHDLARVLEVVLAVEVEVEREEDEEQGDVEDLPH